MTIALMSVLELVLLKIRARSICPLLSDPISFMEIGNGRLRDVPSYIGLEAISPSYFLIVDWLL